MRHVERPPGLGVRQDLLGAFVSSADAVQDVSVPCPVRSGAASDMSYASRQQSLPVSGVAGIPLLELVVDPAALDKLSKVVLGDGGRNVPPAVDGEVGAPGQREVEPDEGWLLVPELGVPELVGGYGDGVEGVELAGFEEGQRGPVGLQLVLLGGLEGAVLRRGDRVFGGARQRRLFGGQLRGYGTLRHLIVCDVLDVLNQYAVR